VHQVTFVPGQRWVSNTESELGLGIVLEVIGRRVEISFPAAAERRTYAVDNAPLSRVQYDVGQKIQDEGGQEFVIDEVLDNNGCLIYSGRDESEESVVIPEM
jgi:ATP-dependent helicase HepA